MQKNKYLVLSVIIVTLAVFSINRINNANLFSNNTMLVSTPIFTVEPEKAYLDIGESFVFESYSETSTGIVSIKTNWSVADNGVLDDSGCKSYSNQCKIKTFSGPVETKVKAELNGKKVEATVNISSDQYHASAEDEPVNFYIEPEKLLIKKGDKHTFTSYTEAATSAIVTKSTWELDTSDLATDDSKVASIENCDKKSSCTFYAGMNAGNAELHASANDNEAIAYIEVADEVGNPFSDDLPSWAKDYIISLYEKEIISGYEDGTYRAGNSVSRAEFIAILYKLAKYSGLDTETLLSNKNCNKYSDIPEGHFAYEAICFAKSFGWLGDQFNGSTFTPNDPMTREIASDVIYYAILKAVMYDEYKYFEKWYTLDEYNKECMEDADYYYSDVNLYDKYNLPICVADKFDVMKGSNGVFRINDSVNRAELALIMWRIMWYADYISK